MSGQLFPRTWKLQVDTLDVSALDFEFKVLSTLQPFPNRAVITVWNLNQDHRSQLLKRNRPTNGKTQPIPAQLEAGYVDNHEVIFSGDLREVGSKRDPTDWKTVISGDDGGTAYREARFSGGGLTFKKGTPVGQIVNQCAAALGLGDGNASDFAATAEILGVGSKLPHTMVLAGPVAKALTRALDSIGLKWSIQKGVIQLRTQGKPLGQPAIKLTPDTGLLGSPESAIDASVTFGNPQQFAPGAQPKGAKARRPTDPSLLRLRSMLRPGLYPGRKIDLETNDFRGGYVLTECEYVGRTWDIKTWWVDMVARVY